MCKAQENDKRTIPCCGVSGCSGKQFKIMRLARNRLVKNMMDRICGLILLTVKVTWHGRLSHPAFQACICQITQGRLHWLNVGVYTEQVVLCSPWRQKSAGWGRQWMLGHCLLYPHSHLCFTMLILPKHPWIYQLCLWHLWGKCTQLAWRSAVYVLNSTWFGRVRLILF